MKLIPKARPVRIRISSGGVEHSTLDSLKRHFDVSAIIPMINDGRLLRWLRQRGESAVAEMIEAADEIKDTDVLKIFFPELKECKSELDMITKMHFMGLKKDSVYLFERDYASDVDAIKKVYYLIECDWQRILLNLSETNAEMALLYVKECVNGNFDVNDRDSVAMILDEAIELGSRQAENFKTSDAWQEYMHSNDRFNMHSNDRFRNVDKEKMKPIVMSIFNGGLFPQGLSDDEYIIAYFARLCYKMARKFDYGFLYSELLEDLDKFGNKESIIGPEIELLGCILHARGGAKLKLMEEKTPLIDFYLNTNIIQNITFKDKLRFILLHLFDDKIEL